MPGYKMVEFYTSQEGKNIDSEDDRSVARTLIAEKAGGAVRQDGTIVTENPIDLRQELAIDINCCAELTRIF